MNGNSKSINDVVIVMLLRLIMMKVILLFISPFINAIGISNSNVVTILIYFIMMIYIYFVFFKYCKISIIDILEIMLIYSIFAINFLLFPINRSEYFTLEMILVYILYIPVAVFALKKVNSWSSFFEKGKHYCNLGLFITLLVFIFRLTSRLNYMEFSYTLLPFACLSAIYCVYEVSLISIIRFVFYIILMFSYGARGPLMFLAVMFAFSLLFNDNISKKIAVIFAGVITFFTINSSYIQEKILSFAKSTNSYILLTMLSGNMLESNTRQSLYDGCQDFINNMGLNFYGFFGDRQISANYYQPYSHNVIYEFIISFGWIGGTLLFAIIISQSLIACIYNNKNNRLMLLYIWVAFFSRFFLSGSFIMEGKFYLFCGILISLYKSTNVPHIKIKTFTFDSEEK